MRSILFGSSILRDVLRDVPAAVSYLRANHDSGLIAATSRAEVLVGLSSDDAERRARVLLDHLPCLPITQAVADRAVRLCRTHGWSLPQALPAAVALENSLTLATRSPGDLDPSTHGFITVPYTLASDP